MLSVKNFLSLFVFAALSFFLAESVFARKKDVRNIPLIYVHSEKIFLEKKVSNTFFSIKDTLASFSPEGGSDSGPWFLRIVPYDGAPLTNGYTYSKSFKKNLQKNTGTSFHVDDCH